MALKPNNWKSASFDFFNSLYSGATLMIVVAIAAILYTRFGAVWERPIINGLIAASVAGSLYFSIRAILSLPAAAEKVSPSNVEAYVVKWLHRFNLTVKRDPVDGFEFNYIVTTNGERQLAVGKSITEWPDYLNFAARLTTNDEDKKLLATLSDKERQKLAGILKLELARDGIGYSGFSLEGFTILRRIPINSQLDESRFVETVWGVEATINALWASVAVACVDHGWTIEKAPGEENVEARIPRRPKSVGKL